MGIEAIKPVLDLHAELRDHVEHLPVAAHELPDLDVDERLDLIERIVAFLSETLLPHAAAEERVLYPRAARIFARSDDSSGAAVDEAAVRERISELAAADPEDAGHLQELLYAIYALLSSHLWREEQLYLEVLSSEREADARRLLRQLT
ncbi:MAG: hemerythrin domain-containing protein [Gaiellaceae bacterium]